MSKSEDLIVRRMVTSPTFPGYDECVEQCRRAWELWTDSFRELGFMPYLTTGFHEIDYDRVREDPTLKELVVLGNSRGGGRGFRHHASAGVRLRESDGQLQIVGLTYRKLSDARALLRQLKPICESLPGVTACKLYVDIYASQLKDLGNVLTDHDFVRQRRSGAIPFGINYATTYVYPLGSSRLASALYKGPPRTIARAMSERSGTLDAGHIEREVSVSKPVPAKSRKPWTPWSCF